MTSIATTLLLLQISSAASFMSPKIATKTGPLRGRLINVSPQVYEFTGIPFAEAPVGGLRFKKPVPKTPWNGTLDAVKLPDSCMQNLAILGGNNSDVFINGVGMSEDCLYLNLWVPARGLDTRNDVKLAVITFIHGGAFIAGNTMQHLFNGTILASYNNIIVATIQYRLGSLGFAYFGNDDIPGNMGLWDQLEALKWINENIASFGGNTSQIAIFGQSAGAASVAFHIISPKSRPYFTRAIMDSGSGLVPWAYRSAQDATFVANKLLLIASKQCNNTSNNLTAIDLTSTVSDKIACLRSVEAATFPVTDMFLAFTGSGLAFVPVIDGDFLPKDPLAILQSGDYAKVPILAGTNKDEGSQFMMLSRQAMDILPTLTSRLRAIDDLNVTHYRKLLQFGSYSMFSDAPQLKNPLLMKAIELQYWKRGKHGEAYPRGLDVVKAAIDAGGDYAVTCPALQWLRLTSMNNATIYSYYFTHRRRGAMTPNWMGVMHGDELNYIFGEPFGIFASDMNYNSDDKAFSKILMAFWSNFAKFGNPNVPDPYSENRALYLRSWPPYNDRGCKELQFELSVLTQVFVYGQATDCNFKARECSFWTELFPQLVSNLQQKTAIVPPTILPQVN